MGCVASDEPAPMTVPLPGWHLGVYKHLTLDRHEIGCIHHTKIHILVSTPIKKDDLATSTLFGYGEVSSRTGRD